MAVSVSGHTGAVAGSRAVSLEGGSAWFPHISGFPASECSRLNVWCEGRVKPALQRGRFVRSAAKISEQLSGCGGIMRGPGRASPSGWDRNDLLRSRRTDEGWESTGVCEARKRRPASARRQRETQCLCCLRCLRRFCGCCLLLLRCRLRLPRGKLGSDSLTHLGHVHPMPLGGDRERIRFIRHG